MFGLGMGEIVVIAIVALLFIGPDKLPSAAKSIGKGIRDLRRQTRDLQDTIENDTEFGDAVRELRGALRGDDSAQRPPVRKPAPPAGVAHAPPSTPAAPPPAADADATVAGDATVASGATGSSPPAAAAVASGPETGTGEGAPGEPPSLIRGAVGAVARDGEDESG